MKNAGWWTADTIFVTVTGVLMAVVMSVAPFIRPQGISREAEARFQVLDQLRQYEQICQTITPEEARALKSTRRC